MDAERSVKKMVAWSDLLTEALEMVASDDPTRFGTRGPQIIKADIAEAVSEFTTAVVKMAEPGCLNSNSDGTCPDGGKGCCFCPRVYAKAVALEDERKEAAYDGYGTVAGIVKSVVEVSGFETHEGAPGEGTRIYNSKFNGMLTCTVCGQVFKDGKCGCQTVAAAINAGRDNYKLSLEAAAAAIDLPEGTKFVTEAGVITVYVHKGDCGECAYEGDPNCQVECLGVRAREEG
jgi:hypothetical protein